VLLAIEFCSYLITAYLFQKAHMTTIIGYRDAATQTVYMQSDLLYSSYRVDEPSAHSKVMHFTMQDKHNDLLVGVAGELFTAGMLAYAIRKIENEINCLPAHLGTGAHLACIQKFAIELRRVFKEENALDDKGYMGASLLIGFRGALYCVGSDFSAYEPATNFVVIGSGAQFALGAIYALKHYANEKMSHAALMTLGLTVAQEHDNGTRGAGEVHSLTYEYREDKTQPA
jgi:ATP-dependent protease HslVU (ClpYQ) peptidase subunit